MDNTMPSTEEMEPSPEMEYILVSTEDVTARHLASSDDDDPFCPVGYHVMFNHQ